MRKLTFNLIIFHLVSSTALADHKEEVFYELMSVIPEVVLSSGVTVNVHGNYCGPNHGDPSYEQAPVDELDAACKRHDACYESGTGIIVQSCACDYQMLRELLELTDTSAKLEMRTVLVAIGIFGWFSHSPCLCTLPSGETRHLERPAMHDKKECLPLAI